MCIRISSRRSHKVSSASKSEMIIVVFVRYRAWKYCAYLIQLNKYSQSIWWSKKCYRYKSHLLFFFFFCLFLWHWYHPYKIQQLCVIFAVSLNRQSDHVSVLFIFLTVKNKRTSLPLESIVCLNKFHSRYQK